MTIRYGTGSTSIGTVLLALSDRGLCTLKFVEEEIASSELRKQFPTAPLALDPDSIQPLLPRLEQVLAGERDDLGVELDLHGTPFQRAVWTALRGVRRGERLTYSELAERVGRPTAVRAVASACARNPVSILVPCHRILRRDGGLGGYAWGLSRKSDLLRAEGAG